MKNKLSDLNDHLFMQLERLSDEKLTAAEIEKEALRGEAIVAVADQIVRNASIQLATAKLIVEHGGAAAKLLPENGDPMSRLPKIEGRPKLIADNGK